MSIVQASVNVSVCSCSRSTRNTRLLFVHLLCDRRRSRDFLSGRFLDSVLIQLRVNSSLDSKYCEIIGENIFGCFPQQLVILCWGRHRSAKCLPLLKLCRVWVYACIPKTLPLGGRGAPGVGTPVWVLWGAKQAPPA